MGNHDHGHTSDREWYQVAFSDIEPRWNLPNLAFSFKVSSQVNARRYGQPINPVIFVFCLVHTCITILAIRVVEFSNILKGNY